MKAAALACLTLLLAACAATQQQTVSGTAEPAVVRSLTIVRRSDMANKTYFTGPNAAPSGPERFFLAAEKSTRDIHETTYQFRVERPRGADETSYDLAADQRGQTLALSSVKAEVGVCGSGCAYLERTTVELPLELLEQAKREGLRINIASGRSRVTMELPATYVQGFLSATR